MMIKVLIVDDSATARLALRQALESDNELQVVGEAESEQNALRLIRRYDPDIVTMDVYLNHENGIDIAASIMSTLPRPILVITGVNAADPELTYRAVEAGVLEVTSKLCGPMQPDYDLERRQLIRLIKTLSGIPVVHHFRSSGRETSSAAQTPRAPGPTTQPARSSDPKPILIGASTGGPAIVAEILGQLPAPCPLPIVVVQHISRGFSEGFTRWLSTVTGHPTVTVTEPTRIQPGHLYLAQEGRQIRFTAPSYLAPGTAKATDKFIPSYDELLLSAAHCKLDAVSIVLTGMGSDGTVGLRALRPWGGTSIAQKPATCVVSSMPQSAIDAQLIDSVLSPAQIISLLQSLTAD